MYIPHSGSSGGMRENEVREWWVDARPAYGHFQGARDITNCGMYGFRRIRIRSLADVQAQIGGGRTLDTARLDIYIHQGLLLTTHAVLNHWGSSKCRPISDKQ